MKCFKQKQVNSQTLMELGIISWENLSEKATLMGAYVENECKILKWITLSNFRSEAQIMLGE